MKMGYNPIVPYLSSNSCASSVVKADMKSYTPLETAAIFFLANLFLKQGISSEYVMVEPEFAHANEINHDILKANSLF